MKLHTKTWRVNPLVLLFGIIFSAILIVEACKKPDLEAAAKKTVESNPTTTDGITQKFFDVPESADPKVKAIAGNMKRKNDSSHFVEALVQKAGYPRWEFATVNSSESKNTGPGVNGGGGGSHHDSTIVCVPFEIGKATSAVMTVGINVYATMDTAYNILYPNSYKNYTFDSASPANGWNARVHFSMFTKFNHDIYGTDSFSVFDGRILGYDEDDTLYVKITSLSTKGAGTNYFSYDCVYYTVTPKLKAFKGGEHATNVVYEICSANYFNSGGTGYNEEEPGPLTVPGNGGSSGGGGGGSYGGGNPIGPGDLPLIDPCPATEKHVGTNIYHPVLNPCGLPFVPEITSSTVFNPYSADTIGFGSGLQSEFPCVFHFIKDSLMNSNLLAQLACTEVFKDSLYMTLTFDTSTTAVTQNDPSGITTTPNSSQGAYINPANGHTQYYATIKFNPWFLRNGTKEYMMSTVIHEMLHAAFDVRWDQYQKWLTTSPHQGWVDSAWMKEHYANYWEIYSGQNVNLDNIDQHQIMATDYFGMFNDALKYYYNKSASQAVRDSMVKILCYDGLHETAAWKELPMTQGIDTCEYKAKQSVAERSITSGTVTPQGCSGFTLTMSGLGLRAHCQ